MKRFKAALDETVESLRDGDTEFESYFDTLDYRFSLVEEDLESFVEPPDFERLGQSRQTLKARWDHSDFPPVLYGSMVGIKDIISVAGFETRAGSELPPDVFAGPEADVVTKLKQAGAIVAGKTVTTEFACAPPGPTRNPHNLEHTPGGSSSGSAAAVAAGLVPLALGTQTVGSVIRPAAFCGVVGFKPSQERISTAGIVPVSSSADQVGAFTQDLSSMALAASVLCSNWTGRATAPSAPTIGIPGDEYLEQTADIGRRHFDAQCSILSDAGLELTQVSVFEDIHRTNELHSALVDAEAALAHAEWYTEYKERYHPDVVDMIENGRQVDHSTVGRARTNQRALRSRIDSVMRDASIDILIAPAAPGPAPAGLKDTGDPVMNLPWTHAGVPAVTIPVDRTEDGLPLGLQCIAPHGTDEQLLQLAGALAERFDGLLKTSANPTGETSTN